jgi:hypothetical protein
MMAKELIAEQQICSIGRSGKGLRRIEQPPEQRLERIRSEPRHAHAGQLQPFAQHVLDESEVALGLAQPRVECQAPSQEAA